VLRSKGNRGARPAVAALVFAAALAATAHAVAETVHLPVRIRLMTAQQDLVCRAEEAVPFVHPTGRGVLPAGQWTITADAVRPTTLRFHVFVKTFKPAETDAAQAYLDQWRAKGYEPRLVTFGKRFRTAAARLDNRVLWVSLAGFATEAQAMALKARLETEAVWAWIRPEAVAPGAATLTVRDGAGKVLATGPAPLRLAGAGPIGVRTPDARRREEGPGFRLYAGQLEVAVGPDGRLDVCETLPLEDYLSGVLPAEMPALWPIEALKAQAVAARSSVVADLAGKHHLEGFDFCASEHCRAYAGHGGRHPNTDRATAVTAGLVLEAGGRVAPAVFSANCGGWTENNETVWAAPADPVLRGKADFPLDKRPAGPDAVAVGLDRWLRTKPPAFCSADAKNFRWTRRFTAAELTRVINHRHDVGAVRRIELGDRGASGRLKWIRVVGTQNTVTIHKDLPIRLAIGGLYSAMFMLKMEKARGGAPTFVFIGGGRGHGVGLCQHGARAMARAGVPYEEILQHYFTGVTFAKIRAEDET